MNKNKLITSVAIAAVLIAGIQTSNASRNGIEVPANHSTSALLITTPAGQSICSGVYIDKDVLVTAAHCVIDKSDNLVEDIWIAAPGEKVTTIVEAATVRPEITKIVLGGPFDNTGGNSADDIAFIKLAKPFVEAVPVKVATSADLAKLNLNSKVSGYGFGYIYENNSSFSDVPRKYQLEWQPDKFISTSKTIDITSEVSVACVGDSGGPITAITSDQRELLIGVLSGISNVKNNCGTLDQNAHYSHLVTLAFPYSKIYGILLNNVEPTPTPSASATPKASPSPSPSASKTTVVKRTIKCKKGSVIKKITAVKPKCPTGYKLVK